MLVKIIFTRSVNKSWRCLPRCWSSSKQRRSKWSSCRKNRRRLETLRACSHQDQLNRRWTCTEVALNKKCQAGIKLHLSNIITLLTASRWPLKTCLVSEAAKSPLAETLVKAATTKWSSKIPKPKSDQAHLIHIKALQTPSGLTDRILPYRCTLRTQETTASSSTPKTDLIQIKTPLNHRLLLCIPRWLARKKRMLTNLVALRCKVRLISTKIRDTNTEFEN